MLFALRVRECSGSIHHSRWPLRLCLIEEPASSSCLAAKRRVLWQIGPVPRRPPRAPQPSAISRERVRLGAPISPPVDHAQIARRQREGGRSRELRTWPVPAPPPVPTELRLEGPLPRVEGLSRRRRRKRSGSFADRESTPARTSERLSCCFAESVGPRSKSKPYS